MVSPLRRSRTRLPATIVSTVTTSVEYPLSAARRTRSMRLGAVPRQVQLEPQVAGAAPATPARSSSIPVVAIVDSVYGSPCRSADRAAPISPSGCIIRVYPVGPEQQRHRQRRRRGPAADVSAAPTPASTRGRNRQDRNAATFAATAISSSAAPST